ncbi:MAG TPA: phosphoenolpyruvate-utilizing N-terminal domain-containing protein, partial [Victivallales bacterium]|nr:phosphoenolpyruvate-utilizing N-terminal domain-containing protein [Victivallales bacterium]
MKDEKEQSNEIILKGIPASGGIAIGQALVISKAKIIIEEREINSSDIPLEIERLHNALNETRKEIEIFQEKLKNVLGEKESKIFDAHISILNDKILIS